MFFNLLLTSQVSRVLVGSFEHFPIRLLTYHKTRLVQKQTSKTSRVPPSFLSFGGRLQDLAPQKDLLVEDKPTGKTLGHRNSSEGSWKEKTT